MAILLNRIKSTNNLVKISKIIFLRAKALSFLSLIILSLYLLYSTKINSFSNIFLDITGKCSSVSIVLYKNIAASMYNILDKINYLKDINKENLQLKLEIAELKKELSDLRSIRVENLTLKKLLSVVKDVEYPYIVAKLMTVSINSFSHIALIGAGRKQGVELDQIVTDGKWLIGRILEVGDNYSKVILASDVNSRIPVVTSISRERGILAGNNNQVDMIYLQNNNVVQKGEIVVTSGDGTVYPPGIGVAIITNITPERAIVKLGANLYKTDFVTIYSLYSKTGIAQ